MKSLCLALSLAAAVAGCATAPDKALPLTAMPPRWTVSPMPSTTAGSAETLDRAQSLAAPSTSRDDWWSAFGGARVGRLVDGALAANPTVEAATATLRQARELRLVQAASLWPTATVSVGAVQAHGANAGAINSEAPRSRTMLLSASYAPDLFGANANALAAAREQEDAAQWQLQAARLTLEGAVLGALAAEKASIRVEQLTGRLSRIDADVLAIVQARASLGDVAASAVWAQTQQVHDRLAQLEAATLQTSQARDLLASLSGGAPADFVEPDLGFDELVLPDLPDRLPGDVIAHRPDVQVAAAQLKAANAAHQAAIAGLLPQLVVNGDAGFVASSVRRLFDPASLVWDLGLSASQSVFDAGAQRHRVAAAQALADVQSAQYRGAILAAFKDVADGLEAVRHDARIDVEALARAQAARRQLEIASASLALGEVSRQDVLAAQSQMLQMQILQVQARATRLIDAANVMVSLGGSIEPVGPRSTSAAAVVAQRPSAISSRNEP